MGELILVVDDDKSVRDGLRGFFQAAGYDVSVARNGEEGVRLVRERVPSLVVLDVMMPRMDGFEAFAAIRAIDADIPVVFLTAKDASEDEVRALSLGADDFVSKSDEPMVLLARVRHALCRSREADGGGESVLRLGKVVVDLASLTVTEGTRKARLTPTQADILRLLGNAPGHRMSKDEMVDALRGCGYACTDGVVYTHIYNLRERLGSAARHVDCRNRVGYRLVLGT